MDKISEIINYYSENHSLDFKLLQYPIVKHEKKNEILKDISAMANNPSDEEKFIIIGIKKKKGGDLKFEDIIAPVDQASYQQFLDSNIEPQINFEYNVTTYKEHPIAYFKIFANSQRPYLFKKDVRNPIDSDKIEFKKGDGYIRNGTTTDKMVRKDFEKIYEKRFKEIDRKPDIKITPFVQEPEDDAYSKIGIEILDLRIDNLSNHSINIDVEMKIFKSSEISIVPKFEFEKELTKDNIGIFPGVINTAFSHVHFENFNDHIKVSTVKLRTQNNAVHIAQNNFDDNVFCKEILLLKKQESTEVRAEIIIRSDSFTDGALIENIKIEI